MNICKTLINREHGFGNLNTYDIALPRLCATKENSWHGIINQDFSRELQEAPIFSARFANTDKHRHLLAVVNEEGTVALLNTKKSQNQHEANGPVEGCRAHDNAIFDVAWAPGVMEFITASGDHTTRMWQVDKTGSRFIGDFRGHYRSVRTATFRKTDPAVFATGGRDGAILIYDTRVSWNSQANWLGADNSIFSGHHCTNSETASPHRNNHLRPPHHRNKRFNAPMCITGLGFQDDMTLVSCGATDGKVKVWDIRRNYTTYKKEPLAKHCLPYAGTSGLYGYTNLILDETASRVYVSCLDNTIYCFNLNSYSHTPIARYRGFANYSFYVKSCLSPDGKYLLSGSSDEKAYIWNLDYPEEPIVALCGHNAEVTCVAWSSFGDQPIVTCSDDADTKLWRIGFGFGFDNITQNKCPNLLTGYAEKICKERKNAILVNRRKTSLLEELAVTPRSVKRFVEENERTPSLTEKSHKRSLSELNSDAGDVAGKTPGDSVQPQKRQRTQESRVRRLFSPGPSNANRTDLADAQNYDSNNITNTLTPILEDEQMPCSPPSTSNMATHVPGTGTGTGTSTAQIYSPTTNLPNFVRDGYAPHLALMSPKREPQEKVDWLTKLRKMKVKSMPSLANKHDAAVATLSPNSPSSTDCSRTTRRRTSQNSTVQQPQPRTPTSSRRGNCTTLLRFFRVQRPNDLCSMTATLTSARNNNSADDTQNISESGLAPLSPLIMTGQSPRTTH